MHYIKLNFFHNCCSLYARLRTLNPFVLYLDYFSTIQFLYLHNWLAAREKGHSDICVKCCFRSACAVPQADPKHHFTSLAYLSTCAHGRLLWSSNVRRLLSIMRHQHLLCGHSRGYNFCSINLKFGQNVCLDKISEIRICVNWGQELGH